jgi:hypothetical protein
MAFALRIPYPWPVKATCDACDEMLTILPGFAPCFCFSNWAQYSFAKALLTINGPRKFAVIIFIASSADESSRGATETYPAAFIRMQGNALLEASALIFSKAFETEASEVMSHS